MSSSASAIGRRGKIVRRVVFGEHCRNAERMQDVAPEPSVPVRAEVMHPLEQRFVADREQGPAQRRKHRQLVVRPFNRRQRGADRLDFLALVERASADQHVRDPPRFERLDVWARDVVLPADEAAKKQADMLRGDGDRRLAAAFGDLPPAMPQDPLRHRRHGDRERLFDRGRTQVAPLVRLRHRQRDDRRLIRQRGTVRRERNVGRLQRQRVAGHDRLEGAVHAHLDPRHAAETGVEVQLRRAERREASADLAIDADVGPPETVDRLFRITDQEQRPRARPDLTPIRLVVVVGGKQQQDLGLQRIRVLEFVDEDALEARLKPEPHAGAVAHQIAREEEEIEEVERAGASLQLIVAVDGPAQIPLQQRRQVRVREHAELIQAGFECGPGLNHPLARNAVAIRAAPPGPGVRQRAIPREIDQRRFPAVVVRLAVVLGGALQHDFVADAAGRLRSGEQRIAGRGDAACQVRELVQIHERGLDLALAIEVRPGPRSCEVAPLREIPGCPAQPIDRTIVSTEGGPPQGAAHAFRRIGELLLQPAAERIVEQAGRGGLGQHFEEGIDAGFDRTFSQQIGAEPVDGADVRLLETGQREIEPRARLRERGRGAAGAIEPGAQPQLQLAGGLLGERHRDDLSDRGSSFGEDRDDSPDQLGRFPGPGRGLHDQGVIEPGGDRVTGFGVRQRCAHGRSLSACRSPSGSGGLRATRRASSGPHTARKSHQVQARAAGAGGRNPNSIARSTISSASSPARRLASVSGISCSVNAPAAVQ